MAQEQTPVEAPLAYLFKVVAGPTYKPEDFVLPTLQLLSRRFAGELWSYGSYEADICVGRMRLRVVKDAAEKPRIATQVGGIPTVVEHGYDGLLVPKGDVEKLAGGLDALMRDAALRRRLGCAAKERTKGEFSGDSYRKLFEELIVASVHAAGANGRSRTAMT